MKRILLFTLILVFGISLFGCVNKKTSTTSVAPGTNEKSDTIIYKNTQYNFSFTMPATWKGYSIVTDKWEGRALKGPESGKIVQTGPIILIRHPQWTAQKPRQDIPIMVFTIGQWNALKNEEFSVGAAPIPPTELGRNSTYVFALPARYNYAFLPGYDEVQEILAKNPLKAF